MDKTVMRNMLRKARKAVSQAQAQSASITVCQNIMHLFQRLQPKRVAFYLPEDGELNILPTAQWLIKQGCQCYLPTLHPCKKGYLWFGRYRENEALVQNRFGIGEPQYAARKILAPWELDWVLMPLVGFDRDRQRLGMGGGFYDRSFALVQVTMIGCAYDLQCVPEMPTDPWDVALNYIVTEREILCG